MRKIGVISDVHGNIAALKAILSYFDETERCDEIIHTGDVVDIGPRSRECAERLLSRRDVTLLLGNHDRDFVLDCAVMPKYSHVPALHKRQVFDSLGEDLRKQIAQFPLFVHRQCGGSDVMFTHYAFKRVPDKLTGHLFHLLPSQLMEQYPDKTLAQIYDDVFSVEDFDAVFFGHEHRAGEYVGKRLYVDVGSVGCHPEPYAQGIVIDYDDKQWSYRRVSAPYDMSTTRNQMKDVYDGEHLFRTYFMHGKK